MELDSAIDAVDIAVRYYLDNNYNNAEEIGNVWERVQEKLNLDESGGLYLILVQDAVEKYIEDFEGVSSQEIENGPYSKELQYVKNGWNEIISI